jgi:SAM-dependent methyltransferase
MKTTRYYDPEKNRLVYLAQEASADFWDEVWNREKLKNVYADTIPRRHYILRTTKAYLPVGATILEGGCGLAQYSYFLGQMGYKTIALDYAEKTIEFLKENMPQVNPMLGDVRSLALEDGSLDGYWSIGVIEHFYEGHLDILKEMRRVIKAGGYLFITFPTLSWIRKLKIKMGIFPIWSDSMNTDCFYQFALDSQFVRRELEEAGFEIISSQGIDGIKGLRDEIPYAREAINWLYKKNCRPVNFILEMMDRFFLRHFINHVHLFVCRRT